MDKQNALKLLGLGDAARADEIQAALKAKKQDIADKKANAPTEALKAKFESLETKLAEAEEALSADPDKSQPAGDNDSRSEEEKRTGPSPLSQTKLADLPGLAPQDAAQVELQPGQIIASRYEIKELIGQGGMGAVYRAFDKNRDEDIAIKVLLPSLTKNERALERFLNEARISSKLSHQNIVNVFDVQRSPQTDGAGDLYFLTMELLEGQDLAQLIQTREQLNQPFTAKELVEVIEQLAPALDYAHQHTVHRDIKPENVWLDEDGHYKLMDFGIAQLQSTSQRTQTGAAMGTAYYMAPEQLKGSKNVDARADIYALGVMLYTMATGDVPAGLIKPLHEKRPDISPAFSNAVMQCLEADPTDRPQSANDLLTLLQQGLAAKGRKIKKGATSKSSRPTSAGHLHGGGPNKLAIAVVLLLFLGGGAFAWQQGWLDALKPLDKELIAQQKADATKLLGQIKRLQRLLDDSLRDLDRDVSDAKRENSKRYSTLQTWQDNAEDFITRSATLTDLQGELAVGEGYLRDDKAAPKAVATLEQVKQGYEGLLSCFDNLEGFEKQQAQLEKLQEQGYGIGADLVDEVQATEKQMARVVAQGQECQTVSLTSKAIAVYRELLKKAEPVLAADQKAQQAKSDWQAYKKKYGFTGKSSSAEKAQQQYDDGKQKSRSGELEAALPLFQQATESWSAAKGAPDVAALVKEKEAEWAAAAAAAKRKQAAAARIALLMGKLVKIPGRNFRMQEHEVTWNQYQPCIDAGACPNTSRDNGWGKGNRPVIEVSWNDVQAYIKWLNRQTSQKFRLPTKAEWEYAAQAGSTTQYSWGDSIACSQARYGRSSDGECRGSKDGTVPVKSFSPNRWGLYDMHGNVWEWTQSCWKGDCGMREKRGGSWVNTSRHLRSTERNMGSASVRSSTTGFRLVQDR